jgi:hypothetical protein
VTPLPRSEPSQNEPSSAPPGRPSDPLDPEKTLPTALTVTVAGRRAGKQTRQNPGVPT